MDGEDLSSQSFDKYWDEITPYYRPFVFNSQPEPLVDSEIDTEWRALKTSFAKLFDRGGSVKNRLDTFTLIQTLCKENKEQEKAYYFLRKLINGHFRLILLENPFPLKTLELTFQAIQSRSQEIQKLSLSVTFVTKKLDRFWIPLHGEIPFSFVWTLLLNSNLDFCFSRNLFFWKWFREIYFIFPIEIRFNLVQKWFNFIFIFISSLKVEIDETDKLTILDRRKNYEIMKKIYPMDISEVLDGLKD